MSERANKPVDCQIAVAAREAERLRIAQDLHDAFGGNLTAAALLLASLQSQVGNNHPSQQTIAQLRDMLGNSRNRLQQVIQDLRPPELADGLIPALRHLCRQWQEYSSIACYLSIASGDATDQTHTAQLDASEEMEINAAIHAKESLALYRITQEALNNVARHAHASVATVVLLQDDASITLKIADNGKASKKNLAHGNGLTGIAERTAMLKGSMRAEVLATGGSCISVQIPLCVTLK